MIRKAEMVTEVLRLANGETDLEVFGVGFFVFSNIKTNTTILTY